MSAQRLSQLFVRVGLPMALVVAGVICVIAGHGSNAVAGLGVVLLGVALMVALLDWLFRLSLSSNRDREVEEEARDQYRRTGHWPDEEQD